VKQQSWEAFRDWEYWVWLGQWISFTAAHMMLCMRFVTKPVLMHTSVLVGSLEASCFSLWSLQWAGLWVDKEFRSNTAWTADPSDQRHIPIPYKVMLCNKTRDVFTKQTLVRAMLGFGLLVKGGDWLLLHHLFFPSLKCLYLEPDFFLSFAFQFLSSTPL